MTEAREPGGTASRRAVLAGAAGVAGVAVVGLTACGSSDPGGGGNANAPIKVSDIPVGGGKVITGKNVVVTQPAAGQFKAFTAVCTHQGCIVATVANGLITCPCHGSQYSITDGSVQRAAPGLTVDTQRPLAAKTVTVSGSDLTVS